MREPASLFKGLIAALAISTNLAARGADAQVTGSPCTYVTADRTLTGNCVPTDTSSGYSTECHAVDGFFITNICVLTSPFIIIVG